LIGDRQVGLALVQDRYADPETPLLIYPETRKAVAKTPHEFVTGDTVALPISAVVLMRFPEQDQA